MDDYTMARLSDAEHIASKNNSYLVEKVASTLVDMKNACPDLPTPTINHVKLLLATMALETGFDYNKLRTCPDDYPMASLFSFGFGDMLDIIDYDAENSSVLRKLYGDVYDFDSPQSRKLMFEAMKNHPLMIGGMPHVMVDVYSSREKVTRDMCETAERVFITMAYLAYAKGGVKKISEHWRDYPKLWVEQFSIYTHEKNYNSFSYSIALTNHDVEWNVDNLNIEGIA